MGNVEEIQHSSFGRCVRVSNDKIELVTTLDFGPRIIRFAKINGENMMLEDVADEVNQNENAAIFKEKYGELGVWHIYGGHRLWTSPEAMPRSYYPENEPVKYERIENGIRLLPNDQIWTQNRMEIEVTMSPDGNTVVLNHKIYNIGAWPQEFAPWCLTVLSKNGKEVIPVPQRKTGLLHNRKLALWDYTQMNDKRVYWGNKYITLRQDPDAEGPFKFGIDSQHAWAAYFNHGDMLVKRFDVVDGGNYPDEGMNFETFTNQYFIEMESLGELKTVMPGECNCHREILQLFPDVVCPSNDEAEIDAIVEKYINQS